MSLKDRITALAQAVAADIKEAKAEDASLQMQIDDIIANAPLKVVSDSAPTGVPRDGDEWIVA